jgi:hypothetical protein
MIAQTFLDNTTMAIPNLARYNVSYVAIFITPSGGTSGGYQGFGEDGKWYWMARIGNNTMWQNYKVIYQETVTPTSTGSTSTSYTQVLMDPKGRAVYNDTIATNDQLNDHTMLGYMMAFSTTTGTEQPSPYFTRVFSSSNNFVFLYQVKTGKPALVTMQPVKNKLTYGEQVIFAGNLTDSSGKPLTISNPQVSLEYSDDSGQSWLPINTVTASSNGTFRYAWTPDVGTVLVRAHYLGTEGPYVESSTAPQQVAITAANVALNITTSTSSAAVGSNLTVTVQMTPPVIGANVTVSYTVDNKTFTPIRSLIMNSTSMSFTWTVTVSGSFTLTANYPGDTDHNQASAAVTLNKP